MNSELFSGVSLIDRLRPTRHNQIVQAITLDIEQLKDVTLDDPELMREVLAALIDDTTRQLDFLDRAVKQADAKETVRLAHYSKGACANVGAASAAGILQSIEHKAGEGDFGACDEYMQSLRIEFGKLQTEAAGLTA